MENTKKVRLLFYLSTIVIFGLSTISHFLYKWSGYSNFVGFFAPTNESVFQHLKMFFYPTILYYLISFLFFAQKYNINPNKWFLAPLITIVVTAFVVVGTYYTFTYGFNMTSMVIDILSLVIGLFISSIISLNIYKFNKVVHIPGVVSLIFVFVLAIAVTYLDTNPQENDLFYDHENETYQRVLE